ncbi:MAG: PilC/PilY family type IV pilus protein [Pseudomonadota bacterium]
MNRNNHGTCHLLIRRAVRFTVCLYGLIAANTQAQQAADFSANPPFTNSDENFPSGGGSAVSSFEFAGVGAAYQAFYHKSYTDNETGKSIRWGGMLHALFVDDSGRLREDNGVRGMLEDTSIDYVVDIFRDNSVEPVRSRFKRFQQVGSGEDAILNAVGAPAELDELHTIWNARDTLAGISQDDLLMQRQLDTLSGNFSEDAGDKRYVFTWLDVAGQTSTGDVDAGETVAFTPDTFDPEINSNWRYLGLAEQQDAMNLVAYVRGHDIADWRSRLINIPGDNSDAELHWILGDIVNSTPLIVNAPQERYDLVYADNTYKTFKEKYVHRRQMIYVGANDGMLHAFNGGVWNAASRTLQTQGYVDPDFSVQGQAHKLGAEMWAYVPMNLLPHLQWLKTQDYPHVYYVDASPQSFDVNIFADDATHPGGWGTILIAGMRFGGGDFPLDLDSDSSVETLRSSAVIVMDITDPEKPPVLLAELSSPELNFTTGAPVVIKARKPDSSGDYGAPALNRWVLVMGSGPEDSAAATSVEQRPTLLAWDLQTKKYVEISSSVQSASAEPSGFYGSFAAVDHNTDYVDDALYVGTVEGTETAPTGRLKRILLNASAPAFGLADGTAELSSVIDVEKPIVARPLFVHSYHRNENWLFFGTGRSFTREDYRVTSLQRLLGIKDTGQLDTETLELDSLINSTDIVVQPDVLQASPDVWDGQANNSVIIDDVRLDQFDDLFTFMDGKNGWYRNLQTAWDSPAEKVVNDALLLRSSVIFTSYLPGPVNSEQEGESFLYALNYRTGTADPTGFLGATDMGVLRDSVSAGATELAQPSMDVTQGSDPHPEQIIDNPNDEDNDGNVSLIAGKNDGGQEQINLQLPSAAIQRLSWELLDSSF